MQNRFISLFYSVSARHSLLCLPGILLYVLVYRLTFTVRNGVPQFYAGVEFSTLYSANIKSPPPSFSSWLTACYWSATPAATPSPGTHYRFWVALLPPPRRYNAFSQPFVSRSESEGGKFLISMPYTTREQFGSLFSESE